MKSKQNRIKAYLKKSLYGLFFILFIPFYLLFLTALILRNAGKEREWFNYTDGM
jgi:hypothetical protein